MRYQTTLLRWALLAFTPLAFVACSSEEPTTDATPQAAPGTKASYIVTFKESALPEDLVTELPKATANRSAVVARKAATDARRQRFESFFRSVVSERVQAKSAIAFDQVYSNAIGGFAAQLSAEEANALAADPRVASVELDQVVVLEKARVESFTSAAAASAAAADNIPYGITKVGGSVNYTGEAWAWIIDSGIDLDHPDLNVGTSFAATFATGTSNADDANGHGTHVAGTVAAKANGTGVVGVAAGAVVVPVRVFDASGSSANSIIIAGVDYVTANAYAGDVANMSLGGGASTATDNAVYALAAAGVHVAIAAGNSARSATGYSPARVNGTRLWTVSAHDSGDTFARSFSNYGNPPIDVCAPGVSVYSSYKNGGYATLSGTSMACPHVAGILLVNNGVVYSRGTVKRDRDRTPDPLASR